MCATPQQGKCCTSRRVQMMRGRMTDQTGIEWPTCDEDSCIGVRLAATPKCLAHAGDEQRNATLKQLGETGEIDARGVPISQALLEQILASAPRDAADHPTFMAARFASAIFQGDSCIGRAIFEGGAGFGTVTFEGDAGFTPTTFLGDANFYGATFQRDAWFFAALFQGDAAFGRATFQGHARFSGATFQRDARFGGARFEQAHQLGPLLVYGVLRLDAGYFAQLIQIEASTRGLCCQRTRFPAGVQFRLRGAQIVLDDADLSGPSILVGIAALSDASLAKREQALVERGFIEHGLVPAVWCLATQATVELSARPRLLSVQGANVAGLGLANVDLAQGRFAGEHNLDLR